MLPKPRYVDTFLLTFFVIIITFNPYYLFGQLNLFELGIYLPGISAVLDGQIPFRDFFYLRGPFELYMPAFVMNMFGEDVAMLAGWFYFGTVLTLILYTLAGRKIYQTRLIYYLMVPVLVARTFPRVVYTFWGGMRFALGILVVLFLIEYLRGRKQRWLILSGIFSAIALLTSIDVGFCTVAAGVGTFALMAYLQKSVRTEYIQSMKVYIFALIIPLGIYAMYLSLHQALIPYLENVYIVSTQMTKVFKVQLGSEVPDTLLSALGALFNPVGPHFKHMTPVYCYLFFAMYFVYKHRKKEGQKRLIFCIPLFFYGLILYVLAFRNIEAAQFEMALQPEKLLLFFLLEQVFLHFRTWKQKHTTAHIRRLAINFLILALVMSSLGYAWTRYSRRFFTFQYVKAKITGKDTVQLNPLAGRPADILILQRAGGVVVPSAQAEDIQGVQQYLSSQIYENERFTAFGELASYHFLLDRPAVGRFSMSIFAWLDDDWHREYMAQLEKNKPKFVIQHRELPPWFEDIYFQYPPNRVKFQQEQNFVAQYYEKVLETPSLEVYKLLK
ncbi:MAG: hypothetical protein KC684_07750 [Candidatus Omnitrophica bacterium]|nr:hypothetical protein [Candidatus Omnitrophota bacterium]